LLLRQGHAEAAEELYRKALSIAVEQQAKLWELRAAVSLARLWGEQDRRAEARELLSVTPPRSKVPSRPKGARRNLRGLMSGHRLQSRLARIGKVRNRSR
jgi:hypothetical protein